MIRKRFVTNILLLLLLLLFLSFREKKPMKHSETKFTKEKKASKDMVKRIKKAASYYKDNLIGKTFCFLVDGNTIPVQFKAEHFLHMCGVDTSLYARDFYRKAVNGTLHSSEIGFSRQHPYVFAEPKTKNLIKALSLFKNDAMFLTYVRTRSKTYPFGITAGGMTLCFDLHLSDTGNPVNGCYVPYSLRIEDIPKERYRKAYSIDFVLSKDTHASYCDKIEYGDSNDLADYLNDYGLDDMRIDDSLFPENDGFDLEL